jgi:hypothetical protein
MNEMRGMMSDTIRARRGSLTGSARPGAVRIADAYSIEQNSTPLPIIASTRAVESPMEQVVYLCECASDLTREVYEANPSRSGAIENVAFPAMRPAPPQAILPPITAAISTQMLSPLQTGRRATARAALGLSISLTARTLVPDAPSTPSSSTPGSSGTLSSSRFGSVQLVSDHRHRMNVAAKVSKLATMHAMQEDLASPHAKRQVTIEDVRREARILRTLLRCAQTTHETSMIDEITCGLSAPLNAMLHLTTAHGSVASGLQQQLFDSLKKGSMHVARIIDDFESDVYHYLLTQYAASGDMLSLLHARPQHRITMNMIRRWTHQLVRGVQFMHAHSIAHLDVSLENMCINEHGEVVLVDLGMAVQHSNYTPPATTTAATTPTSSKVTAGLDRKQRRTMSLDMRPIVAVEVNKEARHTSAHIRLLTSAETRGPRCTCAKCAMTFAMLLREEDGSEGRSCPGVQLSFLCRPVCENVALPGKAAYMVSRACVQSLS